MHLEEKTQTLQADAPARFDRTARVLDAMGIPITADPIGTYGMR